MYDPNTIPTPRPDYGGGYATPEERATGADELAADLADARAMADEADEAGDDDAYYQWMEEVNRILSAMGRPLEVERWD